MKKTVIIIVSALMTSAALATHPQPVGVWQFNDVNHLTMATMGSDLIESGSHSVVAGISTGDVAISDPLTSYYRCNHNIAANGGGGSYVNEWSLLMDVKVPTSSLGQWVSLYQTNIDNSNDGDCFIATDKTIGVGATNYTKNSISGETWYRIVISVDNGSFYKIYVNGSPWLTGAVQSLDGRFALDPQILFFADENGDDYLVHCTNIAIWKQALTDAQVSDLGSVSSAIMDANTGTGINMLANPSGESELGVWTITDGNDWQATERTDWHWPRTNNYYFTSGRSAHGEMSQIINLKFIANEIDNGRIAAYTKGYIGGGNDGDKGRIIVEYKNDSNTILATTDSGWIEGANSVNWTEFLPYTSDYIIPAGTRSAKYRILTERVSGTDCDAFFDDLCWEYKRVIAGNTAPNTPTISGSTSVSAGVSSTYTFSSADSEASNISYQIDWGNEISNWSALQASGTTYSATHSWPILGVYSVRARARDNNGAVGEWTSAYTVTVSGDAAGVFKSQPYLQNVSKTAMTIAWETDRAVNPTADWGQTSSYDNNTKGLCINAGMNGTATVYVCKVRISGLEADTTYHFRANNGSTAASDATFTTAPNEDKPFTFGVWGDSQQVVQRLNDDANTYPACSNAIFSDMASMTDMAVSVGDVVDYYEYGYYADTFRAYTCNVLGKQKPFFVAFGNHDDPGTSFVHKAAQNSGMHSFSFNYGNAHFTCIDYSDCVKGTMTSDGHISSLPLGWIEQDIASEDAQNATWRFLFIHVPPYCERWFDGSTLMQTYLVPLMNQYNVQICFSGHTHEYERGMLNGTFYVITGVCSYLDILESISEDWSFMTVGGAQDISGLSEGGGLMHGWAEVEIDGTELSLKQHAYNLDGSYFGVIDTINFALSDFNMDTNVDSKDLSALADQWLTEGQYSKYDLADRNEKTVNMKDFAQFADYWFFEGQF